MVPMLGLMTMTKIAILGDTHIGARNDDLNVYQNMKEFFRDTFFPTLSGRGIQHVIHMGDVFDRRKFLNTEIFHKARTDIFEPLNRYNVHVVLGNHDCVKTSTNFPNTSVFLEDYTNIVYVERPQHIDIDGFQPLIVPWINKENHDETMEVIKKSRAMFVFGHLELNGFEFHAGSVCKHGISPSIFKKFAKVYSGHFHKKSESDIINYVGTPYQTTWIEFTERKGFHIFDTETHEMEFIENPNNLFVEIDDEWDYDKNPLTGKYVRVVVSEEKSKSPQFDLLKSKIEDQGCIKLSTKIIEKVELKEEVQINDEAVDDMNIISISNEYIDKLEYTRKDDLKKLLSTLHRMASDA